MRLKAFPQKESQFVTLIISMYIRSIIDDGIQKGSGIKQIGLLRQFQTFKNFTVLI